MVGPPIETFGRKPGAGTGKPFRKPGGGGPGGAGGNQGTGGFTLGGGKKFGGGGGRGAPRRDEGPRSFESQPKKEFKPLTDDMKQGKSPLRSFGDLLQFVHKDEPVAEPKKPEPQTKSASDAHGESPAPTPPRNPPASDSARRDGFPAGGRITR
ncbi:MAG: hypothetical protein QM811_30450 [Pirellulales bacterium]